jgi:hypothetical protein
MGSLSFELKGLVPGTKTRTASAVGRRRFYHVRELDQDPPYPLGISVGGFSQRRCYTTKTRREQQQSRSSSEIGAPLGPQRPEFGSQRSQLIDCRLLVVPLLSI